MLAVCQNISISNNDVADNMNHWTTISMMILKNNRKKTHWSKATVNCCSLLLMLFKERETATTMWTVKTNCQHHCETVSKEKKNNVQFLSVWFLSLSIPQQWQQQQQLHNAFCDKRASSSCCFLWKCKLNNNVVQLFLHSMSMQKMQKKHVMCVIWQNVLMTARQNKCI